jgi:hypothetical protein
MDELAEAYTIGSVAVAAGIEGGQALEGASVQLLTDVVQRYGLAYLPRTAIPAESGLAAAFTAAGRQALEWVRGAGTGLLRVWQRAPGAVIAAGAVATTGYVTHQWLTMDERTELERIRQLAETERLAINGMSPEDRYRAFAAVGARLGPKPGASTLLWVGAGVFVALIGWRWWSSR